MRLTSDKPTSAPSIAAEAVRIVAWADAGKLADDEWLVENNETAIIDICRSHAAVLEALTEAADELADLYSAEGEEGDASTPLRNVYPSKWLLIDHLRATIEKADGAASNTDRSGAHDK